MSLDLSAMVTEGKKVLDNKCIAAIILGAYVNAGKGDEG